MIYEIAEKISSHYPKSRLEKVIEGTFGLVLIFQLKDKPSDKFCIKTINPLKVNTSGKDLVDLFRRELKIWLSIPHHLNVLDAMGIQFISFENTSYSGSDNVPIIRMPHCDMSLADWMKKESTASQIDRIIVLAQICNGLKWIYKHGIQGHGDLKPDNILINNLNREFSFRDNGFPSTTHPWQAKVADLGWADIWLDLGGTYHAWRPYLAPERYQNVVVPESSDIYAVGVIACELLTGTHPAGKKTVELKNWKPKKWEKWTNTGERIINLENEGLRELILNCLNEDPDKRPSPNRAISDLSKIVENIEPISLKVLLNIWDQDAESYSKSLHFPWAHEQAAKMGKEELDLAIERLEIDLTESSGCKNDVSVAMWLTTGVSLQKLLFQRNTKSDRKRIVRIACQSIEFIIENYKELDLRKEIYRYDPEKNNKFDKNYLEAWEVTDEFYCPARNSLIEILGQDNLVLKDYQKRMRKLPRTWYYQRKKP